MVEVAEAAVAVAAEDTMEVVVAGSTVAEAIKEVVEADIPEVAAVMVAMEEVRVDLGVNRLVQPLLAVLGTADSK